MRHSILVLVGLGLVVPAVRAQEFAERELRGGVFLSAMQPASGEAKALHLGAVLETDLAHGFGAGVELGHLYTPVQGTGIFSANGSYHYRGLPWLEPFATVGYSRAFSGSAANMFHFGVGANRWLNDHAGVRFEVRDYVSHDLWPSRSLHTLETRFSVVFH